jgi:hypothetical protein
MHRDYSACLVHNQRIAEWTQRVSECRSCRPKRGGQDSDFFRDVLWRSVRYCAVFSTARNQVPDLIGYEKTTKPLALWFIIFGGDKRDRTADLLNAIQALSRSIGYAPPQSLPPQIRIFTQLQRVYFSRSALRRHRRARFLIVADAIKTI